MMVILAEKKLDKYKFKILYLNRNIRRKMPGDVLLAYKYFMDDLTPEQRSSALQGLRAYKEGIVDILPTNDKGDEADTTRMAGSGGVRAIELMTDPQAMKQTEAWMSQFGQSVPGYEFNQAKMIEAQAAQPAPSSEEKA